MRSRDPFEVLLVEDSDADAELVAEGLEAAEVEPELIRAERVEEAWALLTGEAERPADWLPDLLLLDLRLPGASGQELLDRVRGDLDADALPVVVLSTSDDVDDLEDCYDLRANSYVVKPTDYEPFVARIRAVTEYWAQVDRTTGGEPRL